ncbi:M23 family metallopeptidase [Sphingomonas sp. TZW2008]|uniref:M23 family metallopeptidase n=1 Tax=Sphingomonas sp. TZW2008 TaxID=1917973 RepID=UPI000A26760F|nr:M23 family metallopeptidase [Sphingomonas sp. TZW2008]
MRITIPSALLLASTLAACIPSVDRPAYPADTPSPADRPRDMSRGWDRPGEDDDRREQAPRDGDASLSQSDEVAKLPAPRPAWEARSVAADARDVADQVYVVRPGDSLRLVAERLGVGADAVARANGLEAPYTIRTGQRLTIPGGRYHLVRAGQTGIAIARAYGVEWSRIVTANALVEPFILRTGQRVLIPGDARPRSAAERAAAFRLEIDDIITGGEPAIAANQAPAKPVATARRVLPATVAVAAPTASPGRFLWPVDGRIVSRFGAGASGERNNGIKIAVPIDTPVKAAADGTVAYVGDGIAALGGLVIVRHGDNWTSVYGHASKLLVQRGQAVKKGQTIALSGDTGFADRPEVHFELRRGRTPVDPTAQLPRR